MSKVKFELLTKRGQDMCKLLLQARADVEKDMSFKAFLAREMRTLHEALKSTPTAMHAHFAQFHAPVLRRCVVPFLDKKRTINKLSVSWYMHSIIGYHPSSLSEFLAGLIVNNVDIDPQKWGTSGCFDGIMRCPPHLPSSTPVLTTDASYLPSSSYSVTGIQSWYAGGACVLHMGDKVVDYTMGKIPRISFSHSATNPAHPKEWDVVLRCELEALDRGLDFLLVCHPDVTEVVLLVDSLWLVNIFTGKSSVPESSYSDYMRVFSKLRRLKRYELRYIPREVNMVADQLAYHGRSVRALTSDWFSNWSQYKKNYSIVVEDIMKLNPFAANLSRFPSQIPLL